MSEAKHHIEDLRGHLFETIAALRDKDNPMPIDRAKAIAEVGKVIVESAKAETAHLAVVGGRQGSGFIPDGKPTLAPPGAAPALEHKDGKKP